MKELAKRAGVYLHGLCNSQRRKVGDILITDQFPHKNAIAPHISLDTSPLMTHYLQSDICNISSDVSCNKKSCTGTELRDLSDSVNSTLACAR